MKFLQGNKKRRKHKLVRLCQYDFPDTKCFGSNVLDDKVTINASMEIYCRENYCVNYLKYAMILNKLFVVCMVLLEVGKDCD